MNRPSHVVRIVGLFFLGALAYGNALRGPFVFDDVREIASNPLIRDIGTYLRTLRGYRAMPTRYLTDLTFAINYHFGGLGTTGYHAVNIAIHLANAALVYVLTVLTFRTPRFRNTAASSRPSSVALVAATLFVTHPLQTEAVTYIVQRLTSLATFFYVAAVVLYALFRIESCAERPCRRRWALYSGALVCSVAAMHSKEIAFTLPCAIALYEASFFEGPWKERLATVAPLLATAAIIPLTMLDLQKPIGAILADAGSATRLQTSMSRLDYFRTQLVVVVKYLRLVFYPVGQNLEHDVPIYRSFLQPTVLWSALLLGALLALAALLFRWSARDRSRPSAGYARLAGFGIVWFFLALSVESSVVPIVDVMYEHRMYLPSIGLALAFSVGIVTALHRLSAERPARAAALAAVALGVLLASLTLRRNAVWADDVSLWADSVAKSPLRARPHLNLGTALAAAGRYNEATVELRQAVALESTSSTARAQLGAALLAAGRAGEAEPQLRESLRLRPDDPEALFNLALALTRSGRELEAKTWFKRFIEVAEPSEYAVARRIAAARMR